MPNRYNQLLGPQPYVSTYVPMPLDLMAKTLGAKQKQFDDNTEELKATQDLIKIDADPHRRAVRDQLLQYYNNQITELADQYLKTGDPSLMSKTRDLKRQFANDQIRLGLESSYANYNQYQKDIRESIEKGTYAGDIYGSHYDPYAYDKKYTNVEEFKPFDYKGIYNKQDYRTTGQSLISDIAKDSSAWDGIKINKQTGMPDIGTYGQYWKTSNSKSGVSEPKVLEIARTNAENLISDPKTGVWFVDETINKYKPGVGHVDYNSLPEKLQDLVKKEATDYLFTLGAKQIGLNTEYGNDVRFLDAAGAKKQLDEVNMTPTLAPGDTEKAGRSIAEGFDVSSIVTKGSDGQAKIDWTALAQIEKDTSDPLFKDLNDMFSNIGINFSSEKATPEEIAKQLRKVADGNGLKSAEETLLFLASGEVTNKPILIPTTDTDKRLTAKMTTAFDKDKMIYTAPDGTRLSYNDFVAEFGEANIQGIDFGDKDMPKISVQFTDKSGVSKNASFTIPNRTYHTALKKSSNLINDTTDKLYNVDKRTKGDIDYGNAVTNSIATAKSPEDLAQLAHDMQLNPGTSLTDLKPINVQDLSIGTVYTYSDNGNVKAILYTPGVGYTGYPSLVGIIYDEFGNIINSSQFRENKNKKEKQVDYTTPNK